MEFPERLKTALQYVAEFWREHKEARGQIATFFMGLASGGATEPPTGDPPAGEPPADPPTDPPTDPPAGGGEDPPTEPVWNEQELAILAGLTAPQRHRFDSLEPGKQREIMDRWLEQGGPSGEGGGERPPGGERPGEGGEGQPPGGEWEPDPDAPPMEGELRSSMSRNGITLHFAEPTTVGSYPSGDLWFVPKQIVLADPGVVREDTRYAGQRIKNGIMVDPSLNTGPKATPGMKQGYDSHMYGRGAKPQPDPGGGTGTDYSSGGAHYVSELNIGDKLPYDPQPGQSIVASISRPLFGDRPQVSSMAVFHCVTSPPPVGSLRPPYCKGPKDHEWNVRELEAFVATLPNKKRPPSAPSAQKILSEIQGPWVKHTSSWPQRYHAPSDLMPNYSRDYTEVFGCASLALCLDYTPDEKRSIAIALAQIAIDFYGLAENALKSGVGGSWQYPGAGQHNGVKWMLLFAGAAFGDARIEELSRMSFKPTPGSQWDGNGIQWSEDGQVFLVEETSPGVFNFGYGGYGPQDVGKPRWGTHHSRNASKDEPWGENGYQTCCTASCWWGQVLAALMMGLRGRWSREALFLYQDEYRAQAKRRGYKGITLNWGAAFGTFGIDAWDMYRGDF